MREISLTRGMVATVSDEDYNKLIQYNWHYNKAGNNEYAVRYRGINSETCNILMHREIMNVTDPEIQVDHKNGNGLCNERWNLRVCTLQQNCMNRGPKPGSASRYKGVFRDKDNRGIKWRARIEYNGKPIHLGYFRKESDAAIVYNKKAEELFGEFAYLNIIEDGEICQ